MRIVICGAIAGVYLLLVGCAPAPDIEIPPAPQTPYADAGMRDYAVTTDAEFPRPTPAPDIDPGHVYTLPELIDIAERNDPETRIAWERARRAALAVGISQAAYAPIVSARVLAGYAKTSTVAPGLTTPLVTVPDGVLTTTGNETVAALTVDWLLFDFGGRRAAVGAARDLAFAANVGFNGVHQKLIYDVSKAYFQLAAARMQTTVNREAQQNAQTLLDAAEARHKSGIATVIETAQARQQLAQAKFDLAQARGTEGVAYSALLGALGVSPTARIQAEDIGARKPPRRVPQDLDQMIRQSLRRRPDVLTALAKTRADEKSVAAAQAQYRPKIALTGSYSRVQGELDVSDSRIPRSATADFDQPNATLMIGVTIPLFDGGQRSRRLESARSLAAASQQQLRKTQNAAAREIVVAYNTLNTSLSAHAAATELVKAARTTYEAALDYYRHGLGTLSAVSVAQNGLLKARLSQAKTLSDSLTAAASLAFATGTLTNTEAAAHF